MTNAFLRNILSIKVKDIPTSSFSHARLCFLDYLACAAAGSKLYSEKEHAYLQAVESELGVSSVIGHKSKSTMQTAALINGISAHVIELDDGHRVGMIHLGAPIISALLAIAEKERISSDDFLYGIIIGYEVAIRLSCAIQPGCKLKGFHATGVCGCVGAAMAIGAALHYDFEQLKSTISAAITSASGVLEMMEGNTELKPFNAGNAAMSAVSATCIGKSLFRAPKDALGGKRGFLKIFGDEINKEYLTDFNKGFYYIDTIYNKPYAACRHTHPSIEAAMQIRNQQGFNIYEVESIWVDTYKLAVNGHDHTKIEGINSAKMSIPYSLAVALVTGKAGFEEYTEKYINDSQILDIASKISVMDVDELTAVCPQKRVADVKVVTSSGTYKARIEYPKGEPENPLSNDEFLQKYNGLMSFAGYSKTRSSEIFEMIIKSNFDICEIMSLV